MTALMCRCGAASTVSSCRLTCAGCGTPSCRRNSRSRLAPRNGPNLDHHTDSRHRTRALRALRVVPGAAALMSGRTVRHSPLVTKRTRALSQSMAHGVLSFWRVGVFSSRPWQRLTINKYSDAYRHDRTVPVALSCEHPMSPHREEPNWICPWAKAAQVDGVHCSPRARNRSP